MMNFDAVHIDPIGAPIAARVAQDVAAFVERASGEAIVPNVRDGIAPNARESQLLSDALRSAGTQFAAGAIGTQFASAERIAAVLVQALAQLPEGAQTVLRNANLEAALTKLPSAQAGNTAGPIEGTDPPIVVSLSIFLVAALQAVSPAQIAFAASVFASLVSDAGAEGVASTVKVLAEAPQPPGADPIGLPLNYAVDVPAAGQLAQRSHSAGRARRTSSSEQPAANAAGYTEDVVPDVDRDGRPYTDDERRRLARLIRDPRRGTAMEATIAVAAWRAFGLELERDPSAAYDFVDATGEGWNLVSDDDDDRRDRALGAFADTNVILRSSLTLGLRRRAAV